jgi:hypothetical protein
MEFRSHGARSQLWNSTAMAGVHSYGIPEQVQTESCVEFTHRFPAHRRVQSGPGPLRFLHYSCMTALSHRPQGHGPGRVLARFTIFSFGTRKRRPHWPLEVWAPHEKFHSLKLAKLA